MSEDESKETPATAVNPDTGAPEQGLSEEPVDEAPAEEAAGSEESLVPPAEAEAEVSVPEEAEEEDSGPRWFVLRVQAGREDSVKRHIERRAKTEGVADRILRVLVPSERVSELKGRKKRVVQRKLYPGYVMIEMIADEETVYLVRGTQGVGDFVGGSGSIPDPLPDQEVERILGVAEKGNEEPKLDIKFKKGQNVKIKNGPFDNFSGVVEDVNPTKGTIRVIVTIFGRATPVELEYWEVEAI